MNNVLSADEYRLIVDRAPILIWRSDTSGACDYFNAPWLEFRGRTMEQERGNGWAEGLHPQDYQRCLNVYYSAFQQRQTFEMEYRLLRWDGVYRWIWERGAPFHRPAARFGGYVGCCIDVTDRVEAQASPMRPRLVELERLKGLLPICSYCRKVRDDQGYWKQVEDYIREYTLTEFSHGICPLCLSRLQQGDKAGRREHTVEMSGHSVDEPG